MSMFEEELEEMMEPGVSYEDNLPVVITLDPRVAPQDLADRLEKGSTYVRYYSQQSQGSNSSSIQWNIVPPSAQIGVCSKAYVDCNFKFTIAKAAGGLNANFPRTVAADGITYLDQQGTFALRFMPFASTCSSASLTLNQSTVAFELDEYIQALMKYGTGNQSYSCGDNSIFPSMTDQFSTYAAGVVAGTNRNPLGAYEDVGPFDCPRGAFLFTVDTVNSTDFSLIVSAQWSEPITISPLRQGKNNYSSFMGLNNIALRFNMQGLDRMISYDALTHTGIDSITGEINGNNAMNLRLLFLTPPEISKKYYRESGNIFRYPYSQIQQFSKISQSVAPGASSIINANTLQINSIPSIMYVFARRQDSDRAPDLTDTYLQITNLSVNWENKNALLASANAYDLFNISQENGLMGLSWTQWSRFIGSVVAIRFGKDIGLDDWQAVSETGNYQLQVQATCKNISGAAIVPQLFVVLVSDGEFRIMDTTTSVFVGVPRQDIWSQIELNQYVVMPQWSSNSFEGSGFWDSLKRVAHKTFNVGKKAVKFGLAHKKEIMSVAEKAMKYAPLAAAVVGLGYDQQPGMRKVGRALTGGRIQQVGGRAMSGGRIASRPSLKRK